MKSLPPEIESHSGGVQSKVTYKVEQSSKIMNMLSNQTYSDKVKAAIRELATNGWDAHVKAGTTDQVPYVHLPTFEESTFSIRDYGTGLSKEDLQEMYTTYGASDKTESNLFNGCMGIGSKAPFAYSDSFTTTSFYEGNKYVCVNAKDADGLPTLQLFYEGPTDEPNGLLISFPVKKSDISVFKDRAESLFQWFPQPFQSNKTLRRRSRTYCLEGKGWKIRRDTNESCAIMGYVEYPIEMKHFSKAKEDRPNDWYQYYRRGASETPYVNLLNLGLELHFDIGEVDMNISREHLEYTDRVVKTIENRLQAVIDDIKIKVEEKFKNCKNLWEARILMSDLIHGELSSIQSLLSTSKIEFQGRKVETQVEFGKSVKDIFSVSDVSISHYSNGSRMSRTDNMSSIWANKRHEYIFIVADMERGNYAAVKRYLEDKGLRKAYLIKPQLNVSADTAVKHFINCLGLATDHSFIKCSDIPKPPPKKRGKIQKVFKFDTLIKHKIYGTRDQAKYWKPVDIDFKDGGLYVKTRSWNIVYNGERPSYQVQAVIKSLETLGIKVPEIYAVRVASSGKYDKSKDWTCFFEWAKKQLDNNLKQSSVFEHVEDMDALQNFSSRGTLRNLVSNSKVAIANLDNPIKKALDKAAELDKIEKKYKETYREISEACGLLSVKVPKPQSKKSSLRTFIEEIEKKYQILELVDEWDVRGHNNKATIVTNMINLIDSCNEGEN